MLQVIKNWMILILYFFQSPSSWYFEGDLENLKQGSSVNGGSILLARELGGLCRICLRLGGRCKICLLLVGGRR